MTVELFVSVAGGMIVVLVVIGAGLMFDLGMSAIARRRVVTAVITLLVITILLLLYSSVFVIID